jgi:hypothetical protein
LLTLSKWVALCVTGLLVACSPKQDAVEEAVPEQPSENAATPSSNTDASTEALESSAYSASKPLDLSLPEDLSWEQDGELVNAQPRQFDLDGLFNKDDESTMSIYALPTLKPSEEGVYMPEVDGASVSITVKGK